MSRYVLTQKLKKILEARGYKLVCKICDCPLQAGLSDKECPKDKPELKGDLIESKQQRGGRSKLYHARCYDDSHHDPGISDEEIDRDLKEYGIESLPPRPPRRRA